MLDPAERYSRGNAEHAPAVGRKNGVRAPAIRRRGDQSEKPAASHVVHDAADATLREQHTTGEVLACAHLPEGVCEEQEHLVPNERKPALRLQLSPKRGQNDRVRLEGCPSRLIASCPSRPMAA